MEGKSATEQQIEVIASRQLQLISAEQLRDAGMSRKTIESWLKRRRLHPVHHGVYAIHPPPFTREQLWLGAVLACGHEALLSREPAAMVQSFLDPEAVAAHVTVPSGRGRSRSGIVVHRSSVDPRDRRKVGAIPCTSADRILIDGLELEYGGQQSNQPTRLVYKASEIVVEGFSTPIREIPVTNWSAMAFFGIFCQ